jgi:hypothetical protein
MAAPARRERRFLLVGGRLAIGFANTVHSPATGGDGLATWDDVVAFLVAAGAATGPDREGDAGRAFARALALRRVLRGLLATMAARRPLATTSVEAVNAVLRAGAGHDPLVASSRRHGSRHHAQLCFRLLEPEGHVCLAVHRRRGG